MVLIFALPFLVWRLGRTEYFAPLVVVQIITGIVLGPGILGAVFPEYYRFVFNPLVVQSLNGIALWAVMCFVLLAGIELDLKRAWEHRRESSTTAGLALGVPLLTGSLAAAVLAWFPGWVGPRVHTWQFILGVGMACAVTALPILVLFLERLGVLGTALGQRILRYASMDDIAIWGVLALILMDWNRVGRQAGFLFAFAGAAFGLRHLMQRLQERDRWHVALIWLALCGLGADWSGLHFMVGAFLAGAAIDRDWFDRERLDSIRHNVLLFMMPVFFLSTGLRTEWQVGGAQVFMAAALLLVASIGGKLIGTSVAGRVLRWQAGEASLIGWLLQTKALIEIIFANILLDKGVITASTFTALLLMAVVSTMLTIPVVTPMLTRLRHLVGKTD
ncbi:MAG: cation:proton antiporter [Proteobacteria bacterium]|nr:cation:proton antiporter [Pseudomonadota bacterium]